jgi:transposase-like protein
MAPIDDAIAAIESLEPGEHSTYRGIADAHGIQHPTLKRRHTRQTQPHAGAAQKRQKLSPQQEQQLVRYIEDSTERGYRLREPRYEILAVILLGSHASTRGFPDF